ncbi:DUF11 domain-containing protein [Nocardiopsis salina]|uniref:DUF11 domain-containing protein n=1 Tax=Nocardiopsis salina TaxID=245836 RepID=UPI0003635A0E|nr:DUF11 domain-containing protein [Nocardiopsis salina]
MTRIVRRVWWAVVGRVGAGAAGLMVAASAPAAAEPAEGQGEPLVGVSLNGVEGPVEPGEEVRFRITVVNSDRASMEQALLAQHVPDDMEIVSAGRDGVVEDSIANWVVDVPPGEETEYTVTARLNEDVRPGRQLGSTACLLLEREAEPTACATEGVAVAEETVVAKAAGAVDGQNALRVAGAGLVLLLAWLLWRQRTFFLAH